MGYIEDTGASQHFRDARITTIYEGTTGIQANDLVGRKIIRDQGRTIGQLLDEMRALDGALASNADAGSVRMRTALAEAVAASARTVDWLIAESDRDPRLPLAQAVHVLKLMGTVVGGYQMARAMLKAAERLATDGADRRFLEGKIATAQFYADQILPLAPALARIVCDGAGAVMSLDEEQF
jgi:hypothetical protein